MRYTFMLADETELEEVYALINQRIEWMDEVGIQQWNVTKYWEAYPKSYFINQVQQGNLYVLKQMDTKKVIGAVVCLTTDKRWKNSSSVSAYYLHNFVTDKNEPGVGKLILKYVEDLGIKNHKTHIRLDCAIHNTRLNAYYEEKGYILKGQCEDGLYKGNNREKLLF